AVMYLGKIIELTDRDSLYDDPCHPYTKALLAAVPEIGRPVSAAVGGEAASALAPPAGCRFHPRCPSRMDGCDRDEPALIEVAPGHHVACRLYSETPAQSP
ncbi:MAG: ABC transporter ATP-binding protein, partial [Candidatus Aureabacteria bacterium]|nr:ABC transporter ATP-binding protein [Candidatus Auribacterota bacterium]